MSNASSFWTLFNHKQSCFATIVSSSILCLPSFCHCANHRVYIGANLSINLPVPKSSSLPIYALSKPMQMDGLQSSPVLSNPMCPSGASKYMQPPRCCLYCPFLSWPVLAMPCITQSISPALRIHCVSLALSRISLSLIHLSPIQTDHKPLQAHRVPAPNPYPCFCTLMYPTHSIMYIAHLSSPALDMPLCTNYQANSQTIEPLHDICEPGHELNMSQGTTMNRQQTTGNGNDRQRGNRMHFHIMLSAILQSKPAQRSLAPPHTALLQSQSSDPSFTSPLPAQLSA